MYICMRICIYIYVDFCMYVCMYVCVYIYIHTEVIHGIGWDLLLPLSFQSPRTSQVENHAGFLVVLKGRGACLFGYVVGLWLV